MNILLINHYAGSDAYGMEYRPYYLAREWTAMGHDVTILAAARSHLRIGEPPVRGEFTREEIDGIHYVWVKTPAYHGNGVRRLMNILSFVGRLSRRSGRLAKEYRPDLVIASSTYPLDVFHAHRIAHKSGAKLVFEVHDIWPLTLIEVGRMPKWHPLTVWFQHAENFAYRNSDYVVSLLPNAAAYMRAHGMAENKFRHVPNGMVTAEWTAGQEPMPPEHAATVAALKDQGCFLTAYAGAHGVSNALNSFSDAELWLRELQRLAPKDAATVRLQAELLFHRNRTAEALRTLADSLGPADAPPNDREARARAVAAQLEDFGQRLLAANQANAAAPLLQGAEKLLRDHAGRHPEQSLLVAQFLARQRRYDEALKLAEDTWEKADVDSIAAVAAAVAGGGSVDGKQLARLDQIVSAALARHKRPPVLLRVVAMVHTRGQRYQEAEVAYREILKTADGDVVSLNNWRCCSPSSGGSWTRRNS